METCVLFCCLGTTNRNETELHSRGGIRIPEQQQFVTAALTTYELGFMHANTFWKANGVYFRMHQTASPYHVRDGHNHYFGAETFSANGVATPYFGPLGRVSC
jgi:hypothetical protein